MQYGELKDFLDYKVDQYNRSEFVASDPIQIPHRFHRKEDIEISAFLTATIAWGRRDMIIQNAGKMMQLMGNSPYDFVMTAADAIDPATISFCHRTFQTEDFIFFIRSLRHIYHHYGGLESIFALSPNHSLQQRIVHFRNIFFEHHHPARTTKHLSNPQTGSAAKRINMWLRWMCRRDKRGVDFGLWTAVRPSELSCPLDVHSGRVARALGLLQRKQNDQKALAELDQHLRQLDPLDPVKYDFALFGLGVFENFGQ